MPQERPPLTELITRAQTDIESRLPGTDAKVRRTNLFVMARMFAGGLNGVYGWLALWVREFFIDQATEFGVRWAARIWLKVPQIDAEYAVGLVTFTGINGRSIGVGTILQRMSDGVQYETTTAAFIVDGSATVQVEAVEPGQAGNAVAGTTLQLVSTLDGVDAAATTVDGISGGADVEAVESIRSRVKERVRRTPMGGADYDYRTWALEVPGVTRAWVYRRELGAGTVTVRIMRDGDVDPFPGEADLVATQAYIESKCSLLADLAVVAPVPDAVHYEIAVSPDTPAIRAAIEAELRDLHDREATPGGTYYNPATGLPDTGGGLLLTHIAQAISVAEGEFDHTLVAPAANITSSTGHMPVFGSITWA